MTYYNELMNKANELADGIVTFTNSSWHNDACGSIMFEVGKGGENYIRLFAFETEKDMKAEGFEDRFCVSWYEQDDFSEVHSFMTNDENEAIAYAVKLAKEMQDDQDTSTLEGNTMDNTSLAQITLDWIQCELNKGRTVNLSTYLKTLQITPRIAAQWEKAGRDLFKIGDDGCLYIGRGKQYDCIAYSDTVLCQVTSQATIGRK